MSMATEVKDAADCAHPDRVLRDLCHDVAAPVRHIKGLLPLLDASQGAERDELRALCDVAVGRMDALVKGIHGFARIYEDCIDREEVNLEGLAQNEWRALEQRQESRDVELRVSPLGRVRAARAPMSFVFRELFSNALRFGAERLRTVVVEPVGARPDILGFAVSDDGGGVPSDHDYVRIFRATTQLHCPPLPRRAGMGLTCIARIVSCHGGTVSAEASKQGLTITVLLPR